MYVELGLEHWHTGKRSRKYFTRQYDISEKLWNALNQYANQSELCRIGKWDYDKGKLYLFRLKELDDVIDKNANTVGDYDLFKAVKTEIGGGNIWIEQLKFLYEYQKKMISVNVDEKIGTVEKNISKKELEDYIVKYHSNPKLETYKVYISDECISEGIKENDVVLIRKLLDGKDLVVKIIKKNKETRDFDKEDIDEILGAY